MTTTHNAIDESQFTGDYSPPPRPVQTCSLWDPQTTILNPSPTATYYGDQTAIGKQVVGLGLKDFLAFLVLDPFAMWKVFTRK